MTTVQSHGDAAPPAEVRKPIAPVRRAKIAGGLTACEGDTVWHQGRIGLAPQSVRVVHAIHGRIRRTEPHVDWFDDREFHTSESEATAAHRRGLGLALHEIATHADANGFADVVEQFVQAHKTSSDRDSASPASG